MARRQLKTNVVAGGEYTGVGERVMAFREDYNKSKIVTKSEEKDNGEVVFKTFIWKDKSEVIDLLKEAISQGMSKEAAEELILLSSDSEASSRGNVKAKKDYEKQETIALGRALAYLGYSGNGQIASTEEMEEFHNYKNDKFEESVETAIQYLQDSDTLEELSKRWMSLDGELKANDEVAKTKDSLKEKLSMKDKKVK